MYRCDYRRSLAGWSSPQRPLRIKAVPTPNSNYVCRCVICCRCSQRATRRRTSLAHLPREDSENPTCLGGGFCRVDGWTARAGLARFSLARTIFGRSGGKKTRSEGLCKPGEAGPRVMHRPLVDVLPPAAPRGGAGIAQDGGEAVLWPASSGPAWGICSAILHPELVRGVVMFPGIRVDRICSPK